MRKFIQALAAVAVMGLGAVSSAEAFTLNISSGSPYVLVGDTFTASVWVGELTDATAPSLAAYDLDVTFDPSIIAFQGISFASGLTVPGGFGSLQDYDSSLPGLLDAFEVSLEDTVALNAAQTGSFTLFTLTFSAIQAGMSELGLTLQSASTAEGLNLPASELNNFAIGVAPVPLPAAAWLLLSGLTGAFAIGRRRRADRSTPR